MNIKKIVHKLIAMHLESIKAWQPNKFVALDLVTADWTDADFERARIAQRVAEEHGVNKHAEEYEAALTLIEKHAELWG